MGEPSITVLDAVHSKVNREAFKLVSPLLSYKESIWVPRFNGGKKQKIIERSLVNRQGLVLTGLIPYIHKYKRIRVDLKSFEKLSIERLPRLPGITFRPDQKAALASVRRRQRGLIIFPTGTGKTIIAGGIVSMFERAKVIFLCHTRDLLLQTLEDFKSWFGSKRVLALGGGLKASLKEIRAKPSLILISTIQSYSKLHEDLGPGFWDITIVDEVHHCNDLTSKYGKVMQTNLSPRRYGLTATRPSHRKQKLINEGLFGPEIATLEISEGIELGIIARPIVRLVPVPYDIHLNSKCKTYKEYYKAGIVNNEQRNKLIEKSILPEEITLILIEQTEHGQILQKMLSKMTGQRVPFVYGDSKPQSRKDIKEKLKSGEVKLAICSRVWKEGINIPSLNHIINACGMMDEKGVLQTAGRGLRTTKNKKTIKITDFLDPYAHLAVHSVHRVSTYVRSGWI